MIWPGRSISMIPGATATRSPATTTTRSGQPWLASEPWHARPVHLRAGLALPAAPVDHLVEVAAVAAGVGRSGVSRRVADRDRADWVIGFRDAEGVVDRAGVADAEEERAQPLVDHGQQHQHRRVGGVDVPVGHAPALLIV